MTRSEESAAKFSADMGRLDALREQAQSMDDTVSLSCSGSFIVSCILAARDFQSHRSGHWMSRPKRVD